MIVQTPWIAVTGAPSSGKTSVMQILAALGFPVRPEPATQLIEELLLSGRTLPDICADQAWLQHAILDRGIQLEEKLDPAKPMFLDRGAVDPRAYCALYGIDPAKMIKRAAEVRYRKVLMLDRLPFVANEIRIEDDATAARLDVLLEKAYRGFGYDVIRIPVPHIEDENPKRRTGLSILERVRLILTHW